MPDAGTLIVGLGATGRSVLRHLLARGERPALADTRVAPPGIDALRAEHPDLRIATGPLSAELLTGFDRIVLSPGVALAEPAVQAALAAGVEVIGDIELFARIARAPVIAITGSNGKSTVTTLVAEMARTDGVDVRVGANLGEPALDLLGDAEPALYVLELSSFQLETTRSLRARAACVLNVSPDHMDRYATLDDYAGAKRRVYAGAQTVVVNLDDPRTASGPVAAEVVGFTLGRPRNGREFGRIERDGRLFLACGSDSWMAVDDLALAGAHNQANALAALALGTAAGLSREAMVATLRRFRGLAHRTQPVGRRGGIDWYDDSKGTNVGATLAAIEGLAAILPDAARVVLIAGGQGKGQAFDALAEPVRRYVRGVVLIGEDAPKIEAVLPPGTAIAHADSMPAAVEAAARFAQPGDAVLLSPACASFDMFNGYADRGDRFQRAVRERFA